VAGAVNRPLDVTTPPEAVYTGFTVLVVPSWNAAVVRKVRDWPGLIEATDGLKTSPVGTPCVTWIDPVPERPVAISVAVTWNAPESVA